MTEASMQGQGNDVRIYDFDQFELKREILDACDTFENEDGELDFLYDSSNSIFSLGTMTELVKSTLS